MRRWRLCLALAACIMMSGGIGALRAGNKTVNMKLTISINTPPPCDITGGEVKFGNVLISNIDGVNYQKKVPYSLHCIGRINDFLKLQIQGTAVSINGESVLQTDVPGLGIRLQTGDADTLMPPGTTDWLPFQYRDDDIPSIRAVPVKEANVTLTGGDFNAAATLVVDYQ